MPIIKITEPGFQGYTGHIGMTEFKDGVSVEEVSQADADRIGAAMMCQSIDAYGRENHAGTSQRLLDTRDDFVITQPVVVDADREPEPQTDNFPVDAPAESVPSEEPATEDESDDSSPEPESESQDSAVDTYPFTRESLEKIADEGGLPALRNEAVKYGVTGGVTIPEVIEALLALKSNA